MKLLVIGNAVILASRDREDISGDVAVTVEGATEGATLNLIPVGEGSQHDYRISSATTTIGRDDIEGDKTYAITVSWTENENVTKVASGATIRIYRDENNSLYILPAPISSATDIETMWHGIINTLEVIVPFIEDYKYGADAL